MGGHILSQTSGVIDMKIYTQSYHVLRSKTDYWFGAQSMQANVDTYNLISVDSKDLILRR